MSERGTFVTNFIYCEHCAEMVRAQFSAYPRVWAVSAESKHIVSGMIKHSWAGEMEFIVDEIMEPIAADLDSVVTVAYSDDSGNFDFSSYGEWRERSK